MVNNMRGNPNTHLREEYWSHDSLLTNKSWTLSWIFGSETFYRLQTDYKQTGRDIEAGQVLLENNSQYYK